MRYIIRNEIFDLESRPSINMSFLNIAGGFLSFFLAFFANQSYNRFIEQYNNSQRIMGRIMRVCYLGRDILPKHELWRLIRYLNAAHVLGYCGLSHSYGENNTFHPINEKEKLLSRWEVDRIQEVCMHTMESIK